MSPPIKKHSLLKKLVTLNFNYKPTSLFSLEMLNFFLEKTDFWDKKNIPGIPIMVTSMLVTDVLKKCVGDNIKVLVTRLAILVTNIHYLFTLASGTNIQRMLPTSKFCHQHPKIVTNFTMTLTSLSLKITLGTHTNSP